MTAEVIILESKCHCLQYNNNVFPVSIDDFLPVVEFSIKNTAFDMPITVLPVVVGSFLLVAGFYIKISKLCCRCK